MVTNYNEASLKNMCIDFIESIIITNKMTGLFYLFNFKLIKKTTLFSLNPSWVDPLRAASK